MIVLEQFGIKPEHTGEPCIGSLTPIFLLEIGDEIGIERATRAFGRPQ
jgi:hypothetical protein